MDELSRRGWYRRTPTVHVRIGEDVDHIHPSGTGGSHSVGQNNVILVLPGKTGSNAVTRISQTPLGTLRKCPGLLRFVPVPAKRADAQAR